ncbi:hypothetical protein, variant 1 [Aphanomyces invadans]|uniref:Dolichol kinase n=1 Tax=Aphanomyces invadans TaxID=157072 RepID=A0A024URU5_9STRA|nr:hypothetical protein, variant 1 [Aphanomyces invadans]ETW08348.1 hypothetical protein, variant 1 [Aphanomyces invadans]|eukprot:XP_008862153.1 hypothetical protein, variant 1 [Aphanomyces invadans]
MEEPHAFKDGGSLTGVEVAGLVAVPLASLVAMVLLLRVVFKPNDEPNSRKSPNYGAVSHAVDAEEDDMIYAGQVAANYTAPWTATFDLVFLLSMLASFVALIVSTRFARPDLWTNAQFWQGLAIQLAGILAVSTVGGLICRGFGIINDEGYLLTTISASFKVNYTRKCHHLAAYILPLLNPWSIVDGDTTQLPLLWSYFSILVSFVLLVKPLRERFVWCMIQFNGHDRPDDRPHTLKWLVVGNVVPGFVLVVLLHALLGNRHILVVIVAIALIGDALAELVGVNWGRHKYVASSFWSTRWSMRSWEGSAAVYVTSIVLLALGYDGCMMMSS